MNNKNIVFFDGYCNLCYGAVNFILKYDRKRLFYFAPLQGETAKSYNLDDLNSVVFIDEFRKKYEESDAIIEIAVRLFFGGKVFYLFKVFPKFIRDFFYQLIARNRYSFFGKRETCRIATSEEKARFLE